MKVKAYFIQSVMIALMVAGCTRVSTHRSSSTGTVLLDLTQPLRQKIPFFPGGIAPHIELLRKIDSDGYNLFQLVLSDHTGTHVDFPYHFLEKGKKSSDFTLEEMCFPAVVIDIAEKCDPDPDYALTVTDVETYEMKYGAISSDDFVVVRTGWGKYWNIPSRYSGMDSKGRLHFPGITMEATELLIKGRKVRGIGIDTLSIDPGTSRKFKAHRIVLGYGRFAAENLNLPSGLPPRIGKMCIWPLKLENTGGAPARVGAWVER